MVTRLILVLLLFFLLVCSRIRAGSQSNFLWFSLAYMIFIVLD